MALTLRQKIDDLILREFGVNESELAPRARFEEDFGADSLGRVEFAMVLEEEFEIEIDDEAVEKMLTVGAVHSYLERAMKAKKR